MGTIQEWAEKLTSQLIDVRVEGGRVVGSAEGLDRIAVFSAPKGAVLEIRDVGAGGQRRYSIVRPGESPPAQICVISSGRLEKLDIQGDEAQMLPSLRIDGSEQVAGVTPTAIVITGDSARSLELVGHHFTVDPGEMEVLLLENASVGFTADTTLRRIDLRGEATFPTRMRAEHISAHKGVHVRVPNGLPVQGLLAGPDDSPAELTLVGNEVFPVDLVAARSVVHLRGGHLSIRQFTRHVKIEGDGRFVVIGQVSGTYLQSNPSLIVEVYGELVAYGGPIELVVHPEAIVIGMDEPLRVSRVREAQGAEIENLSLFELGRLNDLVELGRATRFTPWLPPRSRWDWLPARRSATSRMADAMKLGGSGAPIEKTQLPNVPPAKSETTQLRHAHFWSRLSTLLAESHAHGGVQSEVRYQAARSRRRAVQSGRERWLLNLYMLVGYGERIVHPLLWLALVSFVGATVILDPPASDLCCDRAGEFLGTWGVLFLAPLAFFRFVRLPEVDPGLETAILIVIRVVGVLLLFFALSAARRVAKAE